MGNRFGIRKGSEYSAVQIIAGGALGLMASLTGASELKQKDVLNLSPEQLGELQVTTVSRRPELLSEAAASVYVITADDIRRAPATTLLEVLRMAPTLFVPSDTGIPGFVGARGQTQAIYSGPNKLLVLIDGRSVYSPYFAGVMWDAQSIVLEDIDRIEVVSGPAGVLWGVNAVDGVINVITKNAALTQGVLASAGVGDRAHDGVFRFGGKLGEETHYRLYGQTNVRGQSLRETDGTRLDDDWRKNSVGGRMDWRRGGDAISAHFGALTADQGQPLPYINAIGVPPPPYPRQQIRTGHMLGRYTHTGGDGSNLAVQLYVDHIGRLMQPTVNDVGNVVDLEVQRSETPSGKHKLAWGGNIRMYRNTTWGSPYIVYVPEAVTQRWLSLFLQDEIDLSRTLRLTAGARLERGPYGTTDFMPTVRLAKRFAEGQMVWGGVSRAARGPSRLDTDFRMPDTGPALFKGNPNLRSERVDVLELGYRYQGQALTASGTIFKNFYRGLATVTDTNGGLPLTPGNVMDGQARGIEGWADYRATPRWRLGGGFTAISNWYQVNPLHFTVPIDLQAGTAPATTLQLRSSWDLPFQTALDLVYRRVARLGNPNDPLNLNLNPYVPAHDAVDIRFGWKISRQLQLDVIGQNLFGTEHGEYADVSIRAMMAKRIYTRLTWRQ